MDKFAHLTLEKYRGHLDNLFKEFKEEVKGKLNASMASLINQSYEELEMAKDRAIKLFNAEMREIAEIKQKSSHPIDLRMASLREDSAKNRLTITIDSATRTFQGNIEYYKNLMN